VEVIPSVNCEDFKCVKELLPKVKEIGSEWAHFDVSDGTFNSVVTWNEPEQLSQFSKAELPKIEVHLMVDNPKKYLDEWVEAGAKRILVQVEALSGSKLKVSSRGGFAFGEESFSGCEIGLVLNPDTPVEEVFSYLDKIRFVQFLAVVPGPSGQKFQEEILEKIRALRERDKDVIIEVDGGIIPEVVLRLKEAGADIVISSSYIWKSRNPREAFCALGEV
tara:strand:+ start:4680 stop:5339 length:660 start_codon:yes stop_codon:yes gene_type:complete